MADRFMGILHGFDAVQWEHEPADRAAASWTAPVFWRFGDAREPTENARGTGALQNLKLER